MSAQPPRLALLLLRWRLPEDLAEPILGDLEERFCELAERNPGAADRFFWRQTLLAFAPGLGRRRSPAKTTPLKTAAPTYEAWLQDLRYGARRLTKSPGFTAIAALTLALGIGASTTIFSVVHATLLRSLPFTDPDRLVMVWNSTPQDSEPWFLSSADVADLRQRSRALDEIAAVTETVIGPMTGAGTPRHVKISRTTSNFFSMLGVEPVLGRGFEPADAVPVAANAEPPPLPLLLSHAAWHRLFGGQHDVLGTTLQIFGLQAEVIGVMPSHFEMYLPAAADIGHDIDVWWPMRYDFASGPRDTHYLRTVARLAPAVGLGEAQAETATIAQELRREHAHHRQLELGLELVPLTADVVAHVRSTLLFLAGAVGCVMLIACANVANLLLVRLSRRRSELAVMTALGASRSRLSRQLLAESLLLATLGAGGGLVLAAFGIAVLKQLRPAEMPWIEHITVDPALFSFTLAASLLAALVYGLAPALRSSLGNQTGALQVRAASSSQDQSRLRGILVVAEVALSLVLLVGAGLMARTVAELSQVQLGFDPRNLLAVDTAMPDALDREERQQVVEEVERRLAAIPGVQAVGGIFPVPMNGVYVRTCSYSPDAPPQESAERGEAYFRIVTPAYFDTARVSLIAGRQLEQGDNDGEPAVVVIEKRLAERLWPGRDAVGQRLFFQIFGGEVIESHVAGVVADVRQGSLVDERPTIYMPRHFYAAMEMSFVVRASGDPLALHAPIREAIGGLDIEMPVDIRAMEANIDRALLPTRFVLTLMTAFSTLALVLAAIGLYGVLAYSVSQRTREIGVRMAMGATRRDIFRLVLGQGSILALIGTAVGLVAALALTRFMEHHLYGVTPTDPAAFGLTALFLISIALLASWLPARRAARVTPNAALRYE